MNIDLDVKDIIMGMMIIVKGVMINALGIMINAFGIMIIAMSVIYSNGRYDYLICPIFFYY